MRLLAFSDLHRDRGAARRLVELSAQADVVIGAGDFATVRLGLGGAMAMLDGIAKPLLLVPGNNESDTALGRAASAVPAARVLHGDGVSIDGLSFFGVGGAVPPTPFPWSWNVSESRAAELLAGCPDGAVLIVHSPPFGYLDQAFGRHLGSHAILSAIETKRPPLVVCGHIHQCWGQETVIGDSQVVNLGPEGRFFEL